MHSIGVAESRADAPKTLKKPLEPLPVLVLAAEADGFLAAADAQRIARAYGTQAEYFQGMGHDRMLDQGWEKVADRIEGG